MIVPVSFSTRMPFPFFLSPIHTLKPKHIYFFLYKAFSKILVNSVFSFILIHGLNPHSFAYYLTLLNTHKGQTIEAKIGKTKTNTIQYIIHPGVSESIRQIAIV